MKQSWHFSHPLVLRRRAMVDDDNISLADTAGFHVLYLSPGKREMLFIASEAGMHAYTGHPNFVTPAANEEATRFISNIVQERLPGQASLKYLMPSFHLVLRLRPSHIIFSHATYQPGTKYTLSSRRRLESTRGRGSARPKHNEGRAMRARFIYYLLPSYRSEGNTTSLDWSDNPCSWYHNLSRTIFNPGAGTPYRQQHPRREWSLKHLQCILCLLSFRPENVPCRSSGSSLWQVID